MYGRWYGLVDRSRGGLSARKARYSRAGPRSRTLPTKAAPRRASEPSAVNTIPSVIVKSRAGLGRLLLLLLLLLVLGLLLLGLLLMRAPLAEGMSRSDSAGLLGRDSHQPGACLVCVCR